MAILVDRLSLIVRKDSIAALLPGGRKQLEALAGTSSVCSDHQLVRVGCINAYAARTLLVELQSFGFSYLRGGKAVDMVVCDPQWGLFVPCDWLQFTCLASDDGCFGLIQKIERRTAIWPEGMLTADDASYVAAGDTYVGQLGVSSYLVSERADH